MGMEDKRSNGRPTKYKPEYDKQAFKLCLLGSTDKELADFFEVCESTINLWKLEYQGFSDSIKKGRAEADAKVAKALYNRARGYKHRDVHIAVYEGQVIKTETVKHYPPDTNAARMWLHNRRPDKWQDKQKVESTNLNINTAAPTAEEAAEIARKLRDSV